MGNDLSWLQGPLQEWGWSTSDRLVSLWGPKPLALASPLLSIQPCLGSSHLLAGTTQGQLLSLLQACLPSCPGPSIFIRTKAREALRLAHGHTSATQMYGGSYPTKRHLTGERWELADNAFLSPSPNTWSEVTLGRQSYAIKRPVPLSSKVASLE